MKIACIIPDRSDRPQFLEQCHKMLKKQTVPIDYIHLVNYEATSEKPDITQRYRKGYEWVSQYALFDVIFFIENDDYYCPTYIEEMLAAWIANGKPDLFGTSYTYYYHIGLQSYFMMNHPERASAMNTMIKPNLNISWPSDHEVYTDLHLWTHSHVLNGAKKTWTPNHIISIGIKHGVGLCGGRHHKDRLSRYGMKGGLGNESANGVEDIHAGWLFANTDPESFKFYTNNQWQLLQLTNEPFVNLPIDSKINTIEHVGNGHTVISSEIVMLTYPEYYKQDLNK
jgi:hypothetical protein